LPTPSFRRRNTADTLLVQTRWSFPDFLLSLLQSPLLKPRLAASVFEIPHSTSPSESHGSRDSPLSRSPSARFRKQSPSMLFENLCRRAPGSDTSVGRQIVIRGKLRS